MHTSAIQPRGARAEAFPNQVRQDLPYLGDLAAADAAVTVCATYDDYHRLHGELGWRTPAVRLNGTPFLDRGFEHVPSLAAVADLLAELLATAA